MITFKQLYEKAKNGTILEKLAAQQKLSERHHIGELLVEYDTLCTHHRSESGKLYKLLLDVLGGLPINPNIKHTRIENELVRAYTNAHLEKHMRTIMTVKKNVNAHITKHDANRTWTIVFVHMYALSLVGSTDDVFVCMQVINDLMHPEFCEFVYLLAIISCFIDILPPVFKHCIEYHICHLK